MTPLVNCIFDLLEAINNAPGLSAGQLMARVPVSEKELIRAIRFMKNEGLIVTTGEKEKLAYNLSARGREALKNQEIPNPHLDSGGIEPSSDDGSEAEVTSENEFVDIPVFGALPEAKAGADEVTFEAQVCEPLPVIDLDQRTLDVALAEVRKLTAERRKPSSVDDCLLFLREFSDCVKAKFPAAAAMLNCMANHLEKVYQQDV